MSKNHSNSLFVYISKCCGAKATKPACEVEKGQRIGTYVGAKPEGEAGLGTWRCSQCRKVCSVSRHVNKPEKQQEAVTA